MGNCKLCQATVFSISAWEAKCNLFFGANTIFEYRIFDDKSGNKVTLIRKHMNLEISKEEFNNRFKILN